MEREKLRLLEHLISKRDVEGMIILIPGLTPEIAQQYINAELNDYSVRVSRLQNAESLQHIYVNGNKTVHININNDDLDIAHYQRMQELLDGNFSLESEDKPKTM